ncbi:MAG: 6-hydroxycyclohex-1-ene-1-carbonyl-CoA dehydrogenase [Alphaproteobacteria bacterium]|nr:6-hydroxycyclohex-1-ene-1-carbonyl-CoA dehydrogenase [Alphaproteobacteria bacterium]
MSNDTYRWVMTAPGAPLERRTFDPGPLNPDEVVVEIAGCGVCHTDLGYYYDGVRLNHELPLALGHEISGRVVAAGGDAESWTDRAVIIPAVIPCGSCETCRRGHGTICPNQKMPGNDIQGGFASHIRVPSHGLCAVDEKRLAAAGLELADVSVIADAVTTPYQAVRQAEVHPGALAIVVGVGGVGGYTAQVAKAFGATVVAVDVDGAKLDALLNEGVATFTVNASELDGRAIKKAIQAFAAENNLPATEWIIFECSGSGAGQLTAYGLLNRGATLAVVGFTMDKIEIRLSNLMAFHARALGNWGCATELYPDALDLVLDGRVKLTPFIERRPLADINQVFQSVHNGEIARRVVLVPEA